LTAKTRDNGGKYVSPHSAFALVESSIRPSYGGRVGRQAIGSGISVQLKVCRLELIGLAEVELAFRGPATLFADVFGIFDELFVMREVLNQISHVFHIAQMLTVLRMRHYNLFTVSWDFAHCWLLSLLAPVGFC